MSLRKAFIAKGGKVTISRASNISGNISIPVVSIVGPTAAGKSRLALGLAQKFRGEIVSADSAQIYKGMDIGTAKPSLTEREMVKHHLIDIIEPHEQFSVAEFQRLADEAILEIHNKGKLPVICGGTGLYIKAVIDRFAFSDKGKDENLRGQLSEKARNQGTEHLHEILAQVDPDSAQKIHPRDEKRIIRALEVYYTEGKPISTQVEETRPKDSRYRTCMIGLFMPREDLYQKINERTELMIKEGFVEEVRSLLTKYSPEAPGLQILGYREIINYLYENATLEDTVESIKKQTRNYAKKQLTWFRRDERINWFDIQKNQLLVFEEFVYKFLQEYEKHERIQ